MQFNDLKQRLLASSVSIALLIAIFLFADHTFVRFGVAGLILALGSVGVWEYAKMLKHRDYKLSKRLLIFLGIAVMLSFILNPIHPTLYKMPTITVSSALFILFAFHFNKIENASARIGLAFFGICYIAVPLGMLYRIFYPQSPHAILDYGRFWIIYLISVSKVTDVVAYFTGRLWGKKKLAPNISPGKTIVGAVFGVLASVALSGILFEISLFYFEPFSRFSLTRALLLGGIIGVVSQLGDLSESLIKRDCGVKDSNTIPGFGGVLDLLDSLFFTTPLFYFLMGY